MFDVTLCSLLFAARSQFEINLEVLE
jgi:hypothetical protein